MEEKQINEIEETSSTTSSYQALASIGEGGNSKEPWYVSFGRATKDGFLKLVFFIVGVLIDIVMAIGKIIWTIIKLIPGIFVGIYKGIRYLVRVFRDVDWAGRLSFLIPGFANVRHKQYLDGLVYFLANVGFLIYTVFIGAGYIGRLIVLSTEPLMGQIDLGGGIVIDTMLPGENAAVLVYGFVSVLLVFAWAIVYFMSIRGMYDCYKIVHLPEFRTAYNDVTYVLDHYDEFTLENKKGETVHLADLNAFQVASNMNKVWGYNALSSRYISYINFRKYNLKEATGFRKSLNDKIDHLYEKYMTWATAFRKHTWASPLERYLEPKKPDHTPKSGLDYLKKKHTQEVLKFRHTFDKYNDFHSYIRDSRILSGIFAKGELLYDAIYQKDPVSIKNGIEPLSEDTKLKVKTMIPSIVGAFEVSLEAAKIAAKKALHTINALKKENIADVKGEFIKVCDEVRVEYDRGIAKYEELYRHDALDEVSTRQDVYNNYLKVRPLYDSGRNAFMGYLTTSLGLSKKDAKEIYKDYRNAIKTTGDDEMQTIALLETKAKRYQSRVDEAKDPYHGKPVMAKKRVKQFADEKFAFSVMLLPVAGAFLVCVIPLIISIAIGFTNWDNSHQNGYFTWSIEGFAKLFNSMGGSGSQSYGYTFTNLLIWTLIWAVFATFTNYIAGIILALLINRKTIKCKIIFRTMFVLSIAIPQFITLLVMNQLFLESNDAQGPINYWLMSMGLDRIGFFTDTQNGALLPKIMCIVINMWVGVPYTMLSVSGILMNIPEDLYESSRIDGAGPVRQLVSITMPYILFVTGPSLLTTFIGNINNFNVIFFLIGSDGIGKGVGGFVSSAGPTDLLITWLYRMVTSYYKEYNMASIIGMMIFAVCALISLVVYNRMGSIQNEEAFQ